jgi:hypothetical protein
VEARVAWGSPLCRVSPLVCPLPRCEAAQEPPNSRMANATALNLTAAFLSAGISAQADALARAALSLPTCLLGTNNGPCVELPEDGRGFAIYPTPNEKGAAPGVSIRRR